MRIISATIESGGAVKLTPPPATDAFFYTAGRMLSYNRPTKNGIIFFREDCQPVLDTLKSALSNIAHIKPGNEDAPDTYGLKNGAIGSIYDFAEDADGIDIVCKNDKSAVTSMGFKLEDFSPAGRFAAYSQESEYQLGTSPYISVPLAKAKSGYFTPNDVVKTYSFQEGQQLGLSPSRFDARTQSWKYNLDPEGNAVFVRLRPTSFTGVGHVIHPADSSAEIYRYTASVEGEDMVYDVYKSKSGIPNLTDPEIMPAAIDGFGMNNFGDDFMENPDLKDAAQDLSSYDAEDTFDGDAATASPSVNYIPDDDDIYLNLDDLSELKSFSKSMSMYVDRLLSAQKALTPGSKYADPGYQGDKKKRYPLDTPEHIRAAAVFWARSRNKNKYSPTERAKISAKIAAAEHKHKIGSHSNSSYAAVWTTPHHDDPKKVVVNRRFRMMDDTGNLDRGKLISAYQALTGLRGHTALADSMPSKIRDHAIALVRQGLKMTKPTKELSMNPNELTPALNREIEELNGKIQALSQEKNDALTAKDAELATVRQEFSQYKDAQTAVVTEKDARIAELESQINEYKSRELSQERLAQLEAIHPFTAEEKTEEFVKSLSQISGDRFETELVRRELAKTKAERGRTLSQVNNAPTISPAPTFEGYGKGLEISSPEHIL